MTAHHVLFVHPNAEIGGSDIALWRSIATLDPARVRASVVLPREGPLDAKLRETGATIHHVPMRMLRTLPSPRYQAAYLAGLPGTVGMLAALMREVKPDLVHTNSLYCLYGALAARRAGVPHLWHVREIPPRVPVLRPLYGALVRRLSRHVLFMTHACVRGLYERDDISGGSVITDAIDVGRWPFGGRDPARIRTGLGMPDGAPLVGFAARLDPWKGLDVFVEAMARVAAEHPDARFVVAGGAPDGFEAHAAECRARARAVGLGDRMQFVGWRFGLDDMCDLFAAFDVFCHTSVRPEPFGLVLIEAMAAGAPLVAAAQGGPLEIVEDGVSGRLVPPREPAALADAVSALLSDEGVREAMRHAARARVESEFAAPVFAARLHALYDELLA